MKVLFVMRHSGYVRNFESTLRLLCDRGHTVHLAFQIAGAHALLDAADIAQELSAQYPRFSHGAIPAREDAYGAAARELRSTLDYLRYLTPEYREASKLRARAERDVPERYLRKTRAGVFGTRTSRALFARWLRALHRAVPTDARIDGFLDAHQPDVLVVTPLIEPGAPQAEYLRSANALGIRSVLCVASWDNLTNKGLIHGRPDLVTVWNEMMKREAVALHGVAPERVIVTGAQPFDHWFDWQPSTDREAFCRRVRLPSDRPYLLYLCSSRFIAPEEAAFVKTWLQQLRQAAPESLRHVGVLIRPHPQHADQWRDADFGDIGPAVVWPRGGEVPADAQSRSAYFDSIHHSAAVVGINTTAEIESAIVGRRVFTLLAPEFRDSQDGTLHFEHLRSVNGGLVHIARSFAEHHDQLAAALQNPSAEDERCRRFVEAFVRPHGVKASATLRLVETLEALAQTPAPPTERLPAWAMAVQPRLARAGHQQVRAAQREAETKARRQAAKAARAPRPQPDSRPRHWRDVAAAFRGLGYEDRVRFGQSTIDVMPGELLLEHTRPERLDYPDADIHLRVLSKNERERLKACAKEPFTVEWIQRWVRSGEVLYDIGANVGAYSLIAAKKPDGAARVFAFEPGYANLSSLCANIVLNAAADAITPLPIALAAKTGLGVFHLRALEPGAARHTLNDVAVPQEPTVYRQPVMTFSLDEAIERFALPAPNHIKLDVDGGELAILDGAARTLALPSLRSMLIEVSTSMSDEVTSRLVARGLSLEAKIHVRNTTGAELVWYGLFTREAPGDRDAREVRVHTVSR